MDATRTSLKALGLVGAIALLLGVAQAASASTVQFSGRSTENSSIGISFELKGKGCPSGSDCFDKAKVTELIAAPYPFTVCPEELLDSGFLFGNPNTGKATPIEVQKRRRFEAQGGNAGDFTDEITIKGRFANSGKSARGTFEVVRQEVCSTGVVPCKVTVEN